MDGIVTALRIVAIIMLVVQGFGSLGEKDNEKQRNYILGFAVTAAVLIASYQLL